ncbi:unnamed protein product [Ectocarpus sp. CCAP 1310/34]|nr:unnamed protein product [Ectocarpus sp. CCAP 1310/34]
MQGMIGGLRRGRAKMLQAGTRRASLQRRFWVFMRRASRKAPSCKTMMQDSPATRDPSLLHRQHQVGCCVGHRCRRVDIVR